MSTILPPHSSKPTARVLLTTETDDRGGAETMMVSLAKGLRERGVDVHFAGQPREGGWLSNAMKDAGAVVHTIPLYPGSIIETVSTLVSISRSIRPSVIHSHMLALSLYGTIAARLCRVPAVITQHGTGHEIETWTRRASLRTSIFLAKRAITVSSGLKAELISALGGVAKRLNVVWNGVPSRLGNRAEARQLLGLDEAVFVFLAVGNLFPVKGHDVLISATALLPTDRSWKVLIAGKSTEFAEKLSKKQADLGLDSRVRFLGARDDVPQLLAAADAFVMPSLNEGLPIALLEAMMAGLPVVASAVGGIPEAVRHGVDGLLVAPGSVPELREAMDRLMADRPLANSLAASAKIRAQELFSVAAMVENYLNEYRLAGGKI